MIPVSYTHLDVYKRQVDDIAEALARGYTQVIDADLSKYFDSIPHAKLLAVVAERIVDSAILHVLKLWLKAPVIEEDEDGTRKHVCLLYTSRCV